MIFVNLKKSISQMLNEYPDSTINLEDHTLKIDCNIAASE